MATSKSSKAIDSFLEYFQDAKPYHTKLLEVVEQYNFFEEMTVCVCEYVEKEIGIQNTPLCAQTGFGIDYDDECGYDAIDCCDLFDCDGGYGFVFDNSDLLVEETITWLEADADMVAVEGNHISDTKIPVKQIINSTTALLEGDVTDLLSRHSTFLYVNVLQFEVVSNESNTIILAGNHTDFINTKFGFQVEGTETQYNGSYTLRDAVYDVNTDTTSVGFVFFKPVPTNALSGLKIQFRNSNPNGGVYQLQSYSFNGTDTVLEVTSNTFEHTILDDTRLGSIQFRTGLRQPREIDIALPEDDYHRILYTEYDYNNNLTRIYLDGDVNSYTIGVDTIKLFGYFFGPGFDGEQECTKPKEAHIYSLMEEELIIEIDDNLIITPTPTPTSTPTPTPTPTPSVSPPAGLLVNTVEYETIENPTQSLSITTQSSGHRGFTLKNDGTRFYACGNTTQGVYQYDLSTPWDLNSSTYNSTFLDTSGQVSNGVDVQFDATGTRVFVLGGITGGDRLQEYLLGTAWDLGSVTGTGNSFFFDNTTYPDSIYKMQFSPDGTILIVGDLAFPDGILYEFVLSTPWDLTTMNPTGVTKTIVGNGVGGLHITDDGSTMYVNALISGIPLFEYILSTSWDISTAEFRRNMYATNLSEGIYLNESLGYLYGGASGSGPYRRLDFITVTPTNSTELIATGTYGFNNVTYEGDADFDIILPGTSYRLGGLALTDNGSKMIILDANPDYMYMIGLSTPYDISTAVHILDRKSFSDFDRNPVVNSTTISVDFVNGVVITPDGTRLFVLLQDFSNDWMVIQYDLSTPNLLGSATPIDLYNFSADTSGNYVYGIDFADSGTKMYIMIDSTISGYAMLQYSLSIPYDISTMSLVATHEAPNIPPSGYPVGFDMLSGGEKFLLGVSNNRIEEYTLSVPYDITTINDPATNVIDVQAVDPQFTDFDGGNGDSFYYDAITNRIYVASDNRIFQLNLG